MSNTWSTVRAARVAKPVLIGISALLLVCPFGAASAGSKSKKDTAAEAEQTYRKIVVKPENGDRAFLGVTMQELDEDLRKGLDATVKSGVLVTNVIEGSPADEAGMEDGDIIVEFKGRKVESPSELRELVEGSEVGDTVKVKVVRDDKAKTITVALGSSPEADAWSFAMPEHFEWFDQGKRSFVNVLGRGRLGVQVSDLNEDLGAYFGVKSGQGVLVLDVNDDTPGRKMGIRAGDVIVRVKGEEIGSTADLKEAVGELEKGEAFDVVVVRSKEEVTLKGEMDEGPIRVYSKAFPHKVDARVPEIDVRRFTTPEMEGLKKEMEALKKEMEVLKDELEKVKKST